MVEKNTAEASYVGRDLSGIEIVSRGMSIAHVSSWGWIDQVEPHEQSRIFVLGRMRISSAESR